MPSEPPPLRQPGPFSFQRYGCLIILVVFVTLLVGGFLAARYALFGTAMPFRAMASFVEKANPNIKITGVSGDLTTGPRVQSITWGDDPANRSEILDLRVKYNGLSDARAKNRLVISDVGVRKAHVDLADFGPITRTQTTSTSSGGGRSSSRSGNAPYSGEPYDVQIKQVLIEDVLITNRHSPFRLSIPKISWTGFHMTEKSVEAGDIVVESDRVTLHTGPGRTLPMGNESVTFQKTMTGAVQPLLHPSILQPLNFTVDYTFVPEMKAPAFHFTAAEGKVEMATTADGGQTLHIRHLDLATYFDAHKLYGQEAADFPSDLVLEAEAPPVEGTVKIVSGSFRLGVTTFQIEPTEYAAEDAGKAALHGVWRTGAGEIRWSLPIKEFPIQCRPVFSSQPELPPKEILARVFAGKKYEELSDEEKKAVDARLPVYFSPATP